MKCEYCDTTFGEEVTGTCPCCGAALPERKAVSAETVGASMDEERRKELKESGCMYCPYCLSTNVSKRRFFGDPVHVILFLLTCLFAWVMWMFAPWLVIIPILALLLELILSAFLDCSDCKLQWLPEHAATYEKYRFQLYSTLADRAAVRYPGVNQQSVIMNIHSVNIRCGKKEKTASYDHLAKVLFREPAGNMFGYLTIRSIVNKDQPMPQNCEEANNDLMTVVYEAEYEPYYRTMYRSLKGIAQMNNGNTN